jgi:hypothetical protein
MENQKMTPEHVMKKCQIGFGGRNASEQCHGLLAECYGTIGRMLQWIEDEGERTDTCTKPVTGKVCRGCRCKHAPSKTGVK